MNAHEAGLRRNPRLLFWSRACLEFKALNGIVTLFYLHRGLTIDQIFNLGIIFSLVTVLAEVPTGYLADRFGRKQTMLIGTIAYTASIALEFIANGFWAFAGVIALMSVCYSCFSGIDEALLYDGLKELHEEKTMTHHNGRLYAGRQMLKIVIPSLAAWFAKDLVEWQFWCVIGLDLFGSLLAIWFTSRLTEPKHRRDLRSEHRSLLRRGIETILRDRFLFRAAFNKICLFVAGFLVWRMYQPYFRELGIGAAFLGLFYFLGQILIFTCHWNIGWLEKRLGSVRILWVTAVLTGILALVAGVSRAPAVVFFACMGLMFFATAREPVFAHALHERIDSRARATTLSSLYFFKAIIDIPLLFLSGWLAIRSLSFVFFVSATLCFIALFVFPVRSRDLLPPVRR